MGTRRLDMRRVSDYVMSLDESFFLNSVRDNRAYLTLRTSAGHYPIRVDEKGASFLGDVPREVMEFIEPHIAVVNVALKKKSGRI